MRSGALWSAWGPWVRATAAKGGQAARKTDESDVKVSSILAMDAPGTKAEAPCWKSKTSQSSLAPWQL